MKTIIIKKYQNNIIKKKNYKQKVIKKNINKNDNITSQKEGLTDIENKELYIFI